MSRSLQSQAGFTLLELIVALAVSALLAVGGAAALSTVIDFYHRSSQRSEARESARATERILRHEWAGRGQMVRSDGLMLEFDTVHPVTETASKTLSMAHVRYACEINSVEEYELRHSVQILRIGFSTSPGDSAFIGPAETQVLATKLKSCAFSFLRYVRESDGRMTPEWVSKWAPETQAPLQMRLALSGVRADLPPVVYEAQTGWQPR